MVKKNPDKIASMTDIADAIRNFKRSERPQPKIYLVILNNSNGVDSWETVKHAYLDETAAELKTIELVENLNESEKNSIEYYVREMPIEG